MAAITIISMHFAPEPTGNAPYVGALAQRLSNNGLSVRVVTTFPHYPAWEFESNVPRWTRNERVGAVHVKRVKHYLPRPPRGLRRLISEISFGIRAAFSRWGQEGPVLLVSPSLFASSIALLAARARNRRRRIVVWVQDIYTLGVEETGQGGDTLARCIRWVESRTLRSADRVVVIHERFAQYLEEKLRVDGQGITVVRNWTHLAPTIPVSRDDARARLGWDTSLPIAVHAGNMGLKQGLETIVEAARLAASQGDPTQFYLIGGGSERDRLATLAQGVRNLTLLHPMAEEDFRLALAAADVLLVCERPGVADMAVPSKLTSYFDAGRPIVAAVSDDGITAEELRAACAGETCDAGDQRSLLAAVQRVTRDAAQAASYGENGRNYRERELGEKAAISRWLEVLKSV